MMKLRIRFLELARQDLSEIKAYLNREASPEIRKAFVEQLDKQLDVAEDFPDINAAYQRNSQYHRLVVLNYPYCAFYKIDNENKTLDIYRVLHTSRDIEQLIS